MTSPRSVAFVFARLAVGLGFLSAVADRFGLWGPPDATNVAWGNFDSFLQYTAKLNPYLASALVPALGWAVTIAEIVVGLLLVAGLYVRHAAAAGFVLLCGFALGMAIGTGIKTAFDASVPAAAAAALLLWLWPAEDHTRA